MGLPNQKAGAGGLEEASAELGQGELRLPAALWRLLVNCRVLSGLKMKLGRRAHTQHTQSPDFMGKAHKRVWEKTSGGRAD